ncbi:MAG: glutamine-hydrolyzing GMP synthase [Elusimicrobiota bacterium]
MIIILDFGSQYTQLIARRVRELQVYCEILPFNVPYEEIKGKAPQGIILSGGPSSVYQKDAPLIDKAVLELGLPVLGICYGTQLLTHLLGGRVERAKAREYGPADLLAAESCLLFRGLPKKIRVWMSHGDKITQLAPGFAVAAQTENSANAVVVHQEKRFYGIQFHPEVAHTPQGKEILANFLFQVCQAEADWTASSFIEKEVAGIRQKVGGGKIICALSGGVDSSVAASLIHRAVGKQLICIFVDNGLLRLGEKEKVVEIFQKNFRINLKVLNAEKTFLDKLKKVIDPEKKRKIIGSLFIRLFEKEAKKIGGIKYLAQGTLYPDVIESVSVNGPSARIKSHHNVGGLPAVMKLKLIEPLRFLFKDEARKVGEELGLPGEIVWRQPFPGPGLAVRILGEVTKDRLKILRQADAIVIAEIKNADLYRKIWQAFAVLLPIRTVGVMGDERTYENVIALRAVNSQDGMTADWVRLPYDLLERISSRIINEVKGVNRVVYDLSSKPPSTIEWE